MLFQKKFKKLIYNLYYALKLFKYPKNFLLFLRAFPQLVLKPTLFSSRFYLDNNSDIDEEKISPLLHFLASGWKEGRNPNPDFDVTYYLHTYEDVQAKGINPFLHYVTLGWCEGRNPSEHLQLTQYIANNPDILSKNINPLTHKHLKSRQSSQKPISADIQFTSKKHIFIKPLSVIIPIYTANDNAISTLNLLFESITESYPKPQKYLNFIFIDDCSPRGKTQDILNTHNILQRQDVTFIQNKTNQGFVQSVNYGIEQSDNNADILILNSDTEIHGAVFETLQTTCYRREDTASVTPFSNRATLTSILNWPYGSDTIYNLTPRQVSLITQKVGLLSPEISIPTGHGFCMYMSRRALKKTGIFDAKTFGQGYGEENDWSMRAIQQGFKHALCTECFVFHHESQSFNLEQKTKLSKKNTQKLSVKHPYYDAMIHKHFAEDPLQKHRKTMQLFLLKESIIDTDKKTLCFIVHDSFVNHKGGVQQHVRQLVEQLRKSYKNYKIIVISPKDIGNTDYELSFFTNEHDIQLTGLKVISVIELLKKLEIHIDYIHIHHTYNVDSVLLDWINSLTVSHKIYTIHDYFLFCSNPFLINEEGTFCFENTSHNICTQPNCQLKKYRYSDALYSSDMIFVPSNNCIKYIQRLCDDVTINDKLKLLPHFLTFADEVLAHSDLYREDTISNNIVFLGALYPHKGGNIFLNTCRKLTNLGYDTYVWGHGEKSLLKQESTVPKVIPYKDWVELLQLHKKYGAKIIILPSICAETFSYTFHEAIFLLERPVVVGPYGHPADIVKKHSLGVVLSSVNPANILFAVSDIEKNYHVYMNSIKTFKQEHLKEFTKEVYLKNYIHFLTTEK